MRQLTTLCPQPDHIATPTSGPRPRWMTFWWLLMVVLFSQCARPFQPLALETRSYQQTASAPADASEGLQITYDTFGILEISNNRRYVKKIQKHNIRLLPVRLENTTRDTLTVSRSDLQVFGEYEAVATPSLKKLQYVRQVSWPYLLFLLFDFTVSNGGGDVRVRLTYFPIGTAYGISNFAVARVANRKFRQSMQQYATYPVAVPPAKRATPCYPSLPTSLPTNCKSAMWPRPASRSVAAHRKQLRHYTLYIGVVLLATISVSQAQDRAVVHLLTVDKNTQEPVADVELTIDAIQKTFTTNEAGVVTVLLPVSYYNVRASSLGIVNQSFQIVVQRDTTFTFPVTVASRVLDEVKIIESRINEKAKHSVAGIETITPQQVQQLPMLAGEKDVVKSLTLLPGVQTGTEGSAQLLVRGGTADQNLYLLDQATLYHSGHLLGFLSSFNPLATDSVTLYKGGFPARYGGRLSAILDARVKEANLDSLRVEGNIGIISSKASVEVPLVRNKASLLLAGRRTYLDVFQRLATASQPVRNQVSHSFYDVNAKGVYYFGPNHKLTAHFYQDRDSYFDIIDDRTNNSLSENRLTWRNRVMGLTWNHPLSASVQHSLSLSHSRYGLEQKEVREQPEADNNYRSVYTSSIQDISIKNNLRIVLSNYFSLDAGVQFEYYDTEPVTLRSQEVGQFSEAKNLPSQTAYQGALYGEGHLQWRAYTVDVGLRMSHYWVAQRGYFNPEPRLNIKRTINERDAVKLSYTRMAQPLHLLTDPGLGLPINLWVASNEQIAPQTAHQINGGYYTSFLAANNNYSLSVEGYYKQMQDIVAYRDGYSSSSFTNQAQNGPARLGNPGGAGRGHLLRGRSAAGKNHGRTYRLAGLHLVQNHPPL